MTENYCICSRCQKGAPHEQCITCTAIRQKCDPQHAPNTVTWGVDPGYNWYPVYGTSGEYTTSAGATITTSGWTTIT